LYPRGPVEFAKQSLGDVVAGETAVPGAKGAWNGQTVWAVSTPVIVVDVSTYAAPLRENAVK
jgi:hypothetical protein